MNKSRKLIVFFCMLAVSVFCILGASGCGNILMTTCLSDHTLRTEEKVEATCTEDGYERIGCTKCTFQGTKILKAHNNNRTVAQKDATCTESGYESYVECRVCGRLQEEKVIIPATGHDVDFSNTNSKKANCQEKAFCGDCGQSYGSVVTDHTYEEVKVEKVEPTCTTAGRSEYVFCAKCDYHTKEKAIPALGHDGFRTEQLSSKISQVNFEHIASIVNFEKEEAYCGICRQEYVPVCKHYKDFEGSKDAICGELPYCGRCERYYQPRDGQSVEHNYKSIGGKAATCDADGYTEFRECSVCKKQEGKEILPMLGHLQKDITVKATCSDYGYTVENFCVYCQMSALKEAAAHKLEFKDNEREWNSHKRSCACCQRYAESITLALGHDEACESEYSVKRTCLNKGFCGRCKEYYGEVKGSHIGGVASCEEAGVCTRCGVTYIEPWGHDYLNGACLTCGKEQQSE